MDNTGISEVKTYVKKPKFKKVIIARGKGEHTVGAVIISQLIPFRKTMILQLKQRGFDTSKMDWKTLVALYHNVFASNQENKSNPSLPVNTYEFRNNVAFKIHPKDNLNGDITDPKNRDYFLQIGSVVDNIVGVFKVAKAKKRYAIQSGIHPKKVLSDEELQQANAADHIEKVLENKALNVQPFTIGQFKNVIILFVVVYLIWYLFN